MKFLSVQNVAKTLFIFFFPILGMVAQATEISETKPPLAEPDAAVVGFLLAAAAKDFGLSGSPHAVDIRQARVGRMPDGAGNYIYLLCGKFLPADKQSAKIWVSFATIATVDYEQWLGRQADSYCMQRQIKWYKTDQSKVLLTRILEQAGSGKTAP